MVQISNTHTHTHTHTHTAKEKDNIGWSVLWLYQLAKQELKTHAVWYLEKERKSDINT